MEDNFIDYNLFRSRTGFDPLSFFKRNKNISYEEFKTFLNSKKVKSPGKDYYNRAIQHVNVEVKKVQETLKPEDLNVTKVIVEETEIKEVTKEVEVKPKKQTTTRRRRRKKKTNE